MRSVTSAMLVALGGAALLLLAGCPGTRKPPLQATVDTSGTLYVTDSGANAITQDAVVVFDAAFSASSTASAALVAVGGVGPATAVALDTSGTIYLASLNINEVSSYAPPLVAGEAPTVSLTEGVHDPVGLAFDSTGELWVVNETDTAIFVTPFTSSTLPAQTIPLLTSVAGGGIAFDSAGNAFISSFNPGFIMEIASGHTAGPTTAMTLPNLGPRGLAISSDVLYVAEGLANAVAVFNPPFTPQNQTPAFTMPMAAEPNGLAFDPDGNLFVSLANGTVAIYVPPFSQTQGPRVVVATGLVEPAGLVIGQ